MITENPYLKKNIFKWSELCPQTAHLLSEIKSSTHPSHEIDSPEEAEKWFNSLNLYGIDTLFVHGVGCGYYFLAANAWLEQNPAHTLVFLEDDLQAIHFLFQTAIGEQLLYHPQAKLHYFQMDAKNKDSESNLFSLPIHYFLGEICFSSLKSYAEKSLRDEQLIQNHLEYIKNCRGFEYLEYMNFGETFFRNFFRNLFSLPSAYLSTHMFGKFSGIPAIICGAGPSLEKALPLLETMKDRALIFGGGSSMNTLGVNGFQPHFGVSLDPNRSQYARLFMNQAFQVPFFYRNRIFPEALSLIHGDRLYVPGSGGHAVSEYFEKQLGFENSEMITEGNNVVNFSVSIATALGCSPIILVGADLSYTNDQSYAPGILPHPILDAYQEITTKSPQEEIITKTDIHGNQVQTLWKWVSESIWMTQFAITNPQVEFINATGEGIGFEGIKNINLEDVAKIYCSRSFDLRTWIHGEIQNAKFPREITKENVVECMNTLSKSLESCSELCQNLRAEFHKTLKKIDETGVPPENLFTTEAIKALKTLHKEPAYEKVLDTFNKSFVGFLGKREEDLDESNIKEEINAVGVSRMRTIMNKKRYEFLHAVAGSCVQYIQDALNTEKLKDLVFEAFGKQNLEKTKILEKSLKKNKTSSVKTEKNASTVSQIEYYPSGAIKMEQSFEKGVLHGPALFYSEKGFLLANTHFIHGKREGVSEFYYADGPIYSEESFKDDLLEGTQTFYYPDGQIRSIFNYRQGLLDGPVILYYPDGLKKRELYFSQGKRNGNEIAWTIGGIKEFEGSYVNDLPVGAFVTWYSTGTRCREITYDSEGRLIDIKGWGIVGTPLPRSALVPQDYFEKITSETTILTHSVESVFKEMETMMNLITENPALQKIQKQLPDFSEEMLELQQELENLKTINQEIEQESNTQSKDGTEKIWKTPVTRRIIGNHIQEATERMGDEIKALEKVMTKVLKKMENGL